MKTNSYLIEYAAAQIGKPYWFGCFGQTASEKLYKEKKKQYPKMYTATNYPSQYGQRVHDCAGLIKGAYWSDTPTSAPKYDAKTDYGADAFYKNCTKKGKISTFDKVNGRLVFKGTALKKTHVGVYKDGYVIEAKGHAYGVVKTKFNAKDWPFWGQSNLFKEDTTPTPTPTPSEKTYTVTAKSGLRLRKGPGVVYKVICVMPQGSKVTSKEDLKKSWIKVKYNTDEGYCSSKYLK